MGGVGLPRRFAALQPVEAEIGRDPVELFQSPSEIRCTRHERFSTDRSINDALFSSELVVNVCTVGQERGLELHGNV
jgi:hypothetical protein